MEPDARISAGIQKRVRNLAAEELLIEVMVGRGRIFGDTGVEHSNHLSYKYRNYP